MSRGARLALAFAIALAPAGPATAAPPEVVAREALVRTIFECAVDADPALADDIIAGPAWSPDWRKKLRKVYDNTGVCMRRVARQAEMLRIAPQLLRGELARAELAHGRAATKPYALPDLSSMGEGNIRLQAVREHLDTAFAGCLAEKLPVEARSFVDAYPLSPEERAAFAKLQPLVESCQVEAIDYQISGDRLRAALAIMLYSGAHKVGADDPDRVAPDTGGAPKK